MQDTALSPALQQQFDALIQAGTSENTRLAYERDLKSFWAWAKETLNLDENYPVDVSIIIQYIIDRTTSTSKSLRISTLRRYLSSLSIAHQEQGYSSPTTRAPVKLLLRRTQQNQAKTYTKKKSAITVDMLNNMTATCDQSLIGIRDKAIMLVGFASGGRRRSELANMQADDLVKVADGYLITLRQHKADQHGDGLQVPILGEAAIALSAWLVQSGIRKGALFRSMGPRKQLNASITGKTINQIIKQRAALAGYNPDQYSAHGLRVGYITHSAHLGFNISEIMQLSGHRNIETIKDYYRAGELQSNPASHIKFKLT